MQQRYQIGFFVDRQGNRPVEIYLFDHFSEWSVLFNVIARLAYVGQDLIDTDMAKRIKHPIYELRKDRHRIMYAPDGNRFVLLSAFYKRTGKTPTEEIELALARYEEYQQTGNFFEFLIPES